LCLSSDFLLLQCPARHRRRRRRSHHLSFRRCREAFVLRNNRESRGPHWLNHRLQVHRPPHFHLQLNLLTLHRPNLLLKLRRLHHSHRRQGAAAALSRSSIARGRRHEATGNAATLSQSTRPPHPRPAPRSASTQGLRILPHSPPRRRTARSRTTSAQRVNPPHLHRYLSSGHLDRLGEQEVGHDLGGA